MGEIMESRIDSRYGFDPSGSLASKETLIKSLCESGMGGEHHLNVVGS
jgi:hypothetical protein